MKEEQEFGVKEEELDESNVGVLRKRGRPRKDDYYQDQQSLEQDGEENEEVISVTDSEQLKNQLDQNLKQEYSESEISNYSSDVSYGGGTGKKRLKTGGNLGNANTTPKIRPKTRG